MAIPEIFFIVPNWLKAIFYRLVFIPAIIFSIIGTDEIHSQTWKVVFCLVFLFLSYKLITTVERSFMMMILFLAITAFYIFYFRGGF